jgi:HEAT repeat protein
MLAIFARVAGGQVERIRTFTAACPVDAGGRTVHWLTGVRSADGVAWLSRLAGSDTRRLADGAMTALALHADPAALDWLLTAARTADASRVRGQALFWLSQRAGQRAVGTISEALERDPDTDVKKRAVFALSQLPSDEGVPRLIEVARSHSNKAVQKQAFFWLGQSKDPRALAFFREVLAK